LKKNTAKRILDVFLSILGFIWIFPLLFVLFNMVKDATDFNLGNFWDLPKAFSLVANWRDLNDQANLTSGIINSLIYATVGAFIAVCLASLASFALSALNIKHKMFWFLFIYSGTIFPFQTYLIPIFKAYSTIGLYDTKIGLIIFYTAICIPFSMFVLRNFFINISKEVLEAARIDGASDFKAFLKIYMPMAIAPASAVFLFQFTWVWSDLMFGMTFAKSENVRPVMASVSLLMGFQQNVPSIMLASLVVSIPTIVLFFTLNKNLEKGFISYGK
jgi:multiple sugar transport system permease protein